MNSKLVLRITIRQLREAAVDSKHQIGEKIAL
jgi:hypothetical protein